MKEDPIINEIHKNREIYSIKFQHDSKAIIDDLNKNYSNIDKLIANLVPAVNNHKSSQVNKHILN